MLQLNASPNTAPIGIDGSLPNVYRSYSRTTITPDWSLSVYQDFMMRAYVEGSQTDVLTDSQTMVYPPKVNREKASEYFSTANNSPFVTRPGTVKAGRTGNIEGYVDNSDAVLYYVVARMSDFDPNLGPATGTMTILNNVTDVFYQDADFGALPMGWYAYAVQVAYSTGGMSPWTYSNVVGRDMDAAVTFEVTLCDGNVPEDVEITMTGLEFPEMVYEGVTDATGIYTFDQVWKGLYNIELYKIGYQTYQWDAIISEDVTIEVLMSEKMYKPRNLWVDPLTSFAYWDAPVVVALEEDFEGFTFPPDGWTASSNSIGWYRTNDGSGPNWPIPSWTSAYAVANDDAAGSTADGSVDYLITPGLDLREVDTYRLMFDSYYDAAFGLQIATVEYSYDAGANWDVYYALTPNPGSWDYIDIDLASFSGLTATTPVWFAFHSDDGGGWASGWAIDNIMFANGETEPVAYHVYLDGALDGVTDTTFYQYEYLTYGVTYTASVAAQYSCGLSDEVYYTFTSIFLLPPRNLDGLTFDHTVHLWWEPPITPTDVITDNSVFDPNFVAVTEEADFVGTTIDPVGYKPLGSSRAELWNNGPLVNSPGTGTGGADESVLQAGLGTYGFGCQYPLDYRIADDFEVVGTTWTVDEIVVYGYQTNSGPPSSFIGCYLQIYDGDPSAGGTVIWGDQVTNVLTSTDWTGIYRVNAVGGGSARPIMYLACATPGLSLPAGVYWLEYSLDGSGSSGPWTPPVTIEGMLATGNGLQFTGSWGPAMDGSYQQDFPFLFNGTAGGGGGGVIPDNFIGYNLYRDFNNIAYIPYIGEDTTHYFDYELQPLCYEYDVTAVYDLTPYGFPGETAESMYEGPFDVCVEYGWPLAFVEDWNTGSFDPNLWNHGDNWVVNGQFGNPLPCAEFKWDPVLNDYKSALTSYPIDGKYHPGTTDLYIDGRIFFDFDISLVDNGMSGDEKINVEVWDDGNWYNVATFSNADGNFDWTSYHFEISDHAFGKIFKVRFQAEGVNSSGILSWFVDNIHLYRECDAPTDLIATADPDYDENQIFLSWTPPATGGGTGTGEWITWDDGVHFGGVGLTGGGVFSVASHWDADQITAYEGMYITNIRFVPYINAVTTSFTLKVWKGPDAGTLVYEEALSGLVLGDWNDITLATPVAIDVTKELWFGYTVDSPADSWPAGHDEGPAVAGYGDMISLDGVAWDPLSQISPIDRNWNLQAMIVCGDESNGELLLENDSQRAMSDLRTGSKGIIGYNIYLDLLKDEYEFVDFTEDTFYTYECQGNGLYRFVVTTVYEDCESGYSNVASVLIHSIDENDKNNIIRIFPNPASDMIRLESSVRMSRLCLHDCSGRMLQCHELQNQIQTNLDVSSYEPGIYLLRVDTEEGRFVRKLVVVR